MGNKFDEKKIKEFMTSEVYTEEYTLKDLDISARVLQHWDEKGLLPDKKRKTDENHKFNFVDLIWLKIVKDLRLFGLTLGSIKRAKEEIQKRRPVSEILGNENEKINQIDEFKTIKLSFLDLIIGLTLFDRKSIDLYFTSWGHVSCGNLFDDEYNKQVLQFIKTEPVIKIPFFKYFTEFIEEKKNYPFILKNNILTTQEQKILELIRDKKFLQVIIQKKDGEPFIAEAKSLMKIDNYVKLHDIILKKGYETIEIKTQEGNVIFGERTIKHKL